LSRNGGHRGLPCRGTRSTGDAGVGSFVTEPISSSPAGEPPQAATPFFPDWRFPGKAILTPFSNRRQVIPSLRLLTLHH